MQIPAEKALLKFHCPKKKILLQIIIQIQKKTFYDFKKQYISYYKKEKRSFCWLIHDYGIILQSNNMILI